ncbi:transposase-like protein [Corynebacterium diphtheriae PW8]|nr:transposase-like protein [Corynebacterium diphtheriae PW8]
MWRRTQVCRLGQISRAHPLCPNSLNRAGNKKLKNALWQSSCASIRFHERSRQFYERKRKEGKRHNATVVALSRRRLNVLSAMMRNGELYRENAPEVIAAA